MKKTILLVLLAVLLGGGVVAQNLSKMTYQMVLRNANNELIANQDSVTIYITVRCIIDDEVSAYTERHRLSTDRNGVVSITIGDGYVMAGDYASIDWGTAHLTTTVITPDRTLTVHQTDFNRTPGVFYADQVDRNALYDYMETNLYMDSAALAQTAQQTLADFPTWISALTNDAGFLTQVIENQMLSINNDTLFLTNGGFIVLPEGFSGDYRDLTNIPTIPDSVSELNNDANYLTINDLPTTVSTFINDAGYLTLDSLNGQTATMAAISSGWDSIRQAGQLLQETLDSLHEAMKPVEFNAFPCTDTLIEEVAHIVSDSVLLWHGRRLNEDSTYYDSLYTAGWCDSIHKLRLIVDTVDAHPCPGMLTLTDVDGNVYNTVQIGKQCWMKENLRTTKYADGTNITLKTSGTDMDSYRAKPNNSDTTLLKYGYLYNWKAVMKTAWSESSKNPSGIQGICPNGWHVPSNAEWAQLSSHVKSNVTYQCGGTSSNIAQALTAKEGWTSQTVTCSPGYDLTNNNATGFSAMPAGYWNGQQREFGASAAFLSTTETGYGTIYSYDTPEDENDYDLDDDYGWLIPYTYNNQLVYLYVYSVYGFSIDGDNASIPTYDESKTSAFSVRCVKN